MLRYFYVFVACITLLHLLSYQRPHIAQRTVERSVRVREDSARITIDRTSPKLAVRGRLRPRGKSLALDTIIAQDTLHVCVNTDSTIGIRLLPAPRITQEWVKYLRMDSIIKTREVIERAEPWYRSPLLILAGAILGLVLGWVL